MNKFEHGIFSRNILVWGKDVQEKLSKSSILIAGVGGLGCTVSQMLLRSGVGRLILLDCKEIDAPDINRQILYTEKDIGQKKTTVAAKRLRSITGQTTIEIINTHIADGEVSPDFLNSLKINGVADCFDNFDARFALEHVLPESCFMVHGGVLRDFGQVTTLMKGKTPSLQDIVGIQDPAHGPLPVCPSVVGVIGNIMSAEIINALIGRPQLMNTLLIVELADFSFFKLQLLFKRGG